jgi:hypothetical protein
MTRRTGSTTGSRFALDNRELHNNPISGRGFRLQTVNLKRTPNIELFCCHLKEFPAHRMPIYLHWAGLARVRDTNYFTYNEVAVVNMVLNLTRLFLVKELDERPEAMTDQLSKLKLFETDVPGPSSKTLTGHTYRLSSSSMLEFGQVFMNALDTLSGSDTEFDRAFTKYMTGMDFKGNSGEKLHVGYMKAFCRSLKQNCYFVASLAGCKDAFHEKEYFTVRFEREDHLTVDHLQRMVKKTTSEIYRMLRENVFVCNLVKKRPRQTPGEYKRDDGGIQYHLDFGMEFSSLKEDNVSFLLSGHKTKIKFKAFMKKERTRVRFTPDPAPVTHDSSLDSSGEDSDSDSDSDPELDPNPAVDHVELFNTEDTERFESGEFDPPSQARLRSNYESDSDQEDGEILYLPMHQFVLCFLQTL